MPGMSETTGAFAALRYRDYRFMWLGQVGHSATLWMDQVARAVLILALTDSALMLSLVIATRLVPILLFGLLAGAVADRYDRKRILMSTQWVTLSTHAFLAVACLTGIIEVWMVLSTAFVAGTAMAFNQPVRQSLIPLLVPKEILLNAIALNSTALSFMRIGGGVIAGLLLAVVSVGGVYTLTACAYGFVVLMTALMHVPKARPRTKDSSIFGDLGEGFAYIAGNRTLLMVTGLALILFVFGFPYQQVFVPLLAKETLDLGNSGVGWLAASTGVGAVAGSLFVAWRSNVSRPGLQLVINMLVFGAALVAISLQQNLVLTMALLAVAGSMTVTYMAFTNGILLQHSDPEMHGRVMSLLSLDRGLIPLGAIMAGVLVSNLGVRGGLFILGCVILLLSSGVFVLAGRRLARIGPASAARGHGRRAAGEAAPEVAGQPVAVGAGEGR